MVADAGVCPVTTPMTNVASLAIPAQGYRIEQVRTVDVEAIWGEVRKLVQNACRDRTLTPYDVLRRLMNGHAFLWVVRSRTGDLVAAGVTQPDASSEMRWLFAMTLGAVDGAPPMNEWKPHLQAAWAAHSHLHEFSEMRTHCRIGMVKRLEPLGWEEVPMRIMRYPINGK